MSFPHVLEHVYRALHKNNLELISLVAKQSPPQHPPCVAGIVQAGSVSDICTQIVTVVEQEQNKVLWIPDGTP